MVLHSQGGVPVGPLDPEDELEDKPAPSITAGHTLDSFQTKFTSEDDAAFSTLMDHQHEARQKKMWFKQGMEKRLLLEGKDPETFGHLLTWDYHPENALMFHPTVCEMFSVKIRKIFFRFGFPSFFLNHI